MPRGGHRPGAGRPKGSKDAKTLEREKVQKAFDQRVMRAADRLFNAQLSAAEGVTFLFKRTRGKKGESGKVERVTSPAEMIAYIEAHGSASAGVMGNDEYFYLAAERPNHDAVDRMLNRALGKAVESHKFVGDDGKALIPPGGVMFVIQQQPGAENRS